MIDRRRFLMGAGAVSAALALSSAGVDLADAAPQPLATEGWQHLFVLKRNPLFMNVGTVGSPPRDVLKAETDQLYLVASEALSNYHGTFADIRAAAAPGFGCDVDELVVSGNTTEGIGTILNGLALG